MALQCKRCGSGMPDTVERCPTCGSPVNEVPQAAPQPGAGAPDPGIPGLPTPAPTPGIPGLPTPQGQPGGLSFDIPGIPTTAPAPTLAPSPLAAAPAAAPPPPQPLTAGIPGLPNPTPGIPGLPNPGPTPNYLRPGAAAAPMAGGGGGGEIRVSLTGEVYEVPPPTPRGTGPGGYATAGAGPRPGGGAAPPLPVRGPAGRGPAAPSRAPSRQRYGAPMAAAEEKSGGVPIWVVLLIVLVMVGGGAGGFFWWQKMQAPKIAARKITDAFVAKDWNAAYDMMYISPEVDKQVSTLTGGRMDTKTAMTTGLTMISGMMQFKDPQIGAATITGDTATVKVTMTVDMNGQSKTSTDDLPLKLVNGAWKLDVAKGYRVGGGGGGMGGLGGGFGGGSGLMNSKGG